MSCICRVTVKTSEGVVPLIVKEDDQSLIHFIMSLKAEIKDRYGEEVDLNWVKDNVEDMDMYEYQIAQDGKAIVKKIIYFEEKGQQIERIIDQEGKTNGENKFITEMGKR